MVCKSVRRFVQTNCLQLCCRFGSAEAASPADASGDPLAADNAKDERIAQLTSDLDKAQSCEKMLRESLSAQTLLAATRKEDNDKLVEKCISSERKGWREGYKEGIADGKQENLAGVE